MADLLAELFSRESANTRIALERVPFEKADWSPHEKSMTLGRLAGHIAEMGGWGTSILTTDEYDMNPEGGEAYSPPTFESLDDVLSTFDEGVSAAVAALEGMSDQAMMENWAFKGAGEVYFEGPRDGAFRDFIVNHVIHHRGQQSLELHDVSETGPLTELMIVALQFPYLRQIPMPSSYTMRVPNGSESAARCSMIFRPRASGATRGVPRCERAAFQPSSIG
jgi:uncharacterized damage-inducible protein DinB